MKVRSRLLGLLASLPFIFVVLGAHHPVDARTSAQPRSCVQECRNGRGGIDGDHVYSGVGEFRSGGRGGQPVSTGGSYLDECVWQRAEAGETRVLHPIADAYHVEFDEPHWLVWCAPFTIVYTYFPARVGPEQWVIDEMIQDAFYRTPVTLFNPRTSPDGTDDIALVVQTKTWLWVDEELWEPVWAEASIPPITVRTTATPYQATWTGGDEPRSLDCLGPGEPYRFGVGGDEANDDSCTMVFTRDSTVEPDRRIEVAVRWRVEYTCTAYCAGGSLPDIITETSRAVTVTEIQAVET